MLIEIEEQLSKSNSLLIKYNAFESQYEAYTKIDESTKNANKELLNYMTKLRGSKIMIFVFIKIINVILKVK